MSRFSHYVVVIGRIPGIYTDYALARCQTDGIGPAPTGFSSCTAAEKFAREHLPEARDTTEAEAVKKSNGCCWYCGVSLTERPASHGDGQLDHQTSRCQGGSNDISNLVLSCYPCNVERKSGMNLEQFRTWWQQSALHRNSDKPVVFFGELSSTERRSILEARGQTVCIDGGLLEL